MAKKDTLKRTQVKGKKYDLPAEDVEIEKLLQKGLGLTSKISSLNEELESIKRRITEIASGRREGSTTVKLQGISGVATVTYRESYTCDNSVEEIRLDLGSLFERFFVKKTSYSTTKDLKEFFESEHGLGLNNAKAMKKLILSHVKKKEIKPNVKIAPTEE